MGNKNVRTVVSNQTNEMVANVVTNITLSCGTLATSNQTIEVQCVPPRDATSGNYLYPENSAPCIKCMTDVHDELIAKYNDISARWQVGRLQWSDGLAPVDAEFQEVVNKFVSCGKLFCKACAYENLSEVTSMTASTTCDALNNIQNQITQKLTDQVNQTLTENQDFLSPIVGLFGGNSYQNIVNNIVSRIQVKLTNTVLNKIKNNIQNNQNIYLKGTNVSDKYITQKSSYKSVMSYLQKTNLFNDIFSDEEVKELQTLYDDRNTIDDLGNFVLGSATIIQKLVHTVVGRVVFATVAIAALVITMVIFYIIGKLIQTAVKAARKKQASQNELLAETNLEVV